MTVMGQTVSTCARWRVHNRTSLSQVQNAEGGTLPSQEEKKTNTKTHTPFVCDEVEEAGQYGGSAFPQELDEDPLRDISSIRNASSSASWRKRDGAGLSKC